MFAARNLYRRKIRSLLTIAGVAVGVATVITLVAVARGFRSQFNDFFSAGNAHLVVSRKGAADPFISYLSDSLVEKLRQTPGVEAVHPFLFAIKQLRSQPLFFFYGTTRGSPFLSHLAIVEGQSLFGEEKPERSICLGRTSAKYLGLEVGSTLELDDEEFRVTGIFEATVALLEWGGLLEFGSAQRVTGMEGKMNLALLHLKDFDPDDLRAEVAALEKAFPELKATAPAELAGAFDEFDLAEQAVGVFSVLAMLVGGIGVMNTMLMSVFERTKEIGILQAIGWSKMMILRQILVEGTLVCLVGGVLGIAFGILAIECVSGLAEMAWMTGDYSPGLFFEAMAIALGMGVLGTLYPALRAVRITPIEALRYE